MNKRLFSIFFISVFFLLTQTIALADTYKIPSGYKKVSFVGGY